MGRVSDVTELRSGDPEEVAGYRVVRRLGQGGQGVVFLGVGSLGEWVAIKQLRLEDDRSREQFAKEVSAARRVAPFCTARVIAFDLDGEAPYVVSEFIDGPSLERQVRDSGPLRGAPLRRLAIGTATALAAIHEAGVVHRDLKPANVMLSPDGPRVIDFGIARDLSRETTVTSRIFGTPAYMSPEQLRAERVTGQTDMFAWGSVIVYAATGRAPFEAEHMMAVVHRIATLDPDLGGVPAALAEVVACCLTKDASSRPSARQTLAMLLGRSDPVDDDADPALALAEGSRLAEASTGGSPERPSGAQAFPYGRPGADRAAAPGGPVHPSVRVAESAPVASSAFESTSGSVTGPRSSPGGSAGTIPPAARPTWSGAGATGQSVRVDGTARTVTGSTSGSPAPASRPRRPRTLSSRLVPVLVPFLTGVLVVGVLVIGGAIFLSGYLGDDTESPAPAAPAGGDPGPGATLEGAAQQSPTPTAVENESQDANDGSGVPASVQAWTDTDATDPDSATTADPDPDDADGTDDTDPDEEDPQDQAGTVPYRFSGTWSGPADRPDGQTSQWEAIVTLGGGETTGRIRIVGLGCAGTLGYVSNSGDTLIMTAAVSVDTSGRCPESGRITFEWLAADELDFVWQGAAGSAAGATGTLSRQ